MGIEGSSSFDDDNSSEDFIITSDTNVEAEKEIQEEAAYEGVRCLLGEERKELDKGKGIEDIKVLNQSNNTRSIVNMPSDECGRFLSALNIKLITTHKENNCDNQEVGPSCSKRSGVRELRNLVSNVNYERGLRGKGKIHHQ